MFQPFLGTCSPHISGTMITIMMSKQFIVDHDEHINIYVTPIPCLCYEMLWSMMWISSSHIDDIYMIMMMVYWTLSAPRPVPATWGCCCGRSYEFTGRDLVFPCNFDIWGFPEIEVPPNHPYSMVFSIINHPFGGTPMTMETPIYLKSSPLWFLFQVSVSLLLLLWSLLLISPRHIRKMMNTCSSIGCFTGVLLGLSTSINML